MFRRVVRGAVLAVLLYAGVTLGFPYYQYVVVWRAVEEAADLGLARVEAFRKGLWRDDVVLREVLTDATTVIQARAGRAGLTLPAKGVHVTLDADFLRVGAAWETEARLAGYAQRFRFRVEGKRMVLR